MMYRKKRVTVRCLFTLPLYKSTLYSLQSHAPSIFASEVLPLEFYRFIQTFHTCNTYAIFIIFQICTAYELFHYFTLIFTIQLDCILMWLKYTKSAFFTSWRNFGKRKKKTMYHFKVNQTCHWNWLLTLNFVKHYRHQMEKPTDQAFHS